MPEFLKKMEEIFKLIEDKPQGDKLFLINETTNILNRIYIEMFDENPINKEAFINEKIEKIENPVLKKMVQIMSS